MHSLPENVIYVIQFLVLVIFEPHVEGIQNIQLNF